MQTTRRVIRVRGVIAGTLGHCQCGLQARWFGVQCLRQPGVLLRVLRRRDVEDKTVVPLHRPRIRPALPVEVLDGRKVSVVSPDSELARNDPVQGIPRGFIPIRGGAGKPPTRHLPLELGRAALPPVRSPFPHSGGPWSEREDMTLPADKREDRCRNLQAARRSSHSAQRTQTASCFRVALPKHTWWMPEPISPVGTTPKRLRYSSLASRKVFMLFTGRAWFTAAAFAPVCVQFQGI